jgi:hypothetical protein
MGGPAHLDHATYPISLFLLISILSTNLVFYKHFSKIFLDWPQLHGSAHRAPCYGQSLIKICLGHRAPVNLELCRVSMLSTLLHCFAYSYVPSRGLSEARTSTLSTSFTHLEYIYERTISHPYFNVFFKKQRR